MYVENIRMRDACVYVYIDSQTYACKFIHVPWRLLLLLLLLLLLFFSYICLRRNAAAGDETSALERRAKL
jgi:hypothetical protein